MDRSDTIREALVSAPPVSVAGLALAGVSLQDWVLATTLVWLGMQIVWFGVSRYREIRGYKRRKDDDVSS